MGSKLILVIAFIDIGGGTTDGWFDTEKGRRFAFYDGPPEGDGLTYVYRKATITERFTMRDRLIDECVLVQKQRRVDAYLRE